MGINRLSKKTIQIASAIGGWLTYKEAELLYSLAQQVSTKLVIVEIGSWKGRSTVCLGSGARDGKGARVYAIDPHTGSAEHKKMFGTSINTFNLFWDNIKNAGLDSFIMPIKKTSVEAAESFHDPVGFIFIDGAHDFTYVNKDVKFWFPKVTNGGVIAFHDSWHFLGPNLVTAWMLVSSSKIKNPKLIDTITIFEKVNKNNFKDRCINIGFLIFRTLGGIKGFLKLKYNNLG